MLIVGKKNEKSANSCVNDFWLANGINSLQPITSKLLDTDVVAQKKSKKSNKQMKYQFSLLNWVLLLIS